MSLNSEVYKHSPTGPLPYDLSVKQVFELGPNTKAEDDKGWWIVHNNTFKGEAIAAFKDRRDAELFVWVSNTYPDTSEQGE